MSSAQPIVKVIDYFYCVEFQQRESPHVHRDDLKNSDGKMLQVQFFRK